MDTNRTPNKRYNINQKTKEHRTTEEEMEDFILRIKEQETRLTLQEHDDDDDDEIAVWLEEHWLVTGRNGKGLYCKPRYTNDCGT